MTRKPAAIIQMRFRISEAQNERLERARRFRGMPKAKIALIALAKELDICDVEIERAEEMKARKKRASFVPRNEQHWDSPNFPTPAATSPKPHQGPSPSPFPLLTRETIDPTVERLAALIAGARDHDERAAHEEMAAKFLEMTSGTKREVEMMVRAVDARVSEILKEKMESEDDPLFGTVIELDD